ncbi:stromal cell-derived factor 1 isoform X2 [Protopterus annectens]|uniref:Stromal cell-derived factor 1 n=2 Tax=Protopterus annectens TaxID=7888 RepID=A0A2U9NL48_PROAN|nr:stromal cell-derived factor 1 isoform X2 [Protopterus annectens]AWT24650.1 SDF1 [Protopterus annectens]
MEFKIVVLSLVVIGAVVCFTPSHEKPMSLTQRCRCRYFDSGVYKHQIKQLKIINNGNCPIQVLATLKSNKQVCLNPETKWLKTYIDKALGNNAK